MNNNLSQIQTADFKPKIEEFAYLILHKIVVTLTGRYPKIEGLKNSKNFFKIKMMKISVS